jgi:hypothetical protein
MSLSFLDMGAVRVSAILQLKFSCALYSIYATAQACPAKNATRAGFPGFL